MQGSEAGFRLRYWLTLVSGMLECLFFAGLVFGYASLVFVLKEEEYFGWLCVDANGTVANKGEIRLEQRLIQDAWPQKRGLNCLAG